MKKWLILILLPLAASLTLIPAVHQAVNAQRDQVIIYREVLAGDPAAGEGVELTFHDSQQSQLFWDSVLRLGAAEPEADTTFRFYPVKRQDWSWDSRVVEMSFFSGDYQDVYSASGDNSLRAVLDRPARDVISRAKPGESRTEQVAVADYYEYLPVYLHLSGHMAEDIFVDAYYWNDGDEEQDVLARYLNVVPPEDWRLDVEVLVDQDGSVAVSSRSSALPSLTLWAEVTRRGLYFCVAADSPEILRCRDGVGLYFVPFRETGETVTRTDGSVRTQLQVVKLDQAAAAVLFPYDPYETVCLSMDQAEDGKELLLYVREGDELALYVVDGETGGQLQRLTLLEGLEEEAGVEAMLPVETGGAVAVLRDGSFALVTKEENDYRLALTGRLAAGSREDGGWYAGDSSYALIHNDPVLAWDGRRLVWAATVAGRYNLHLGFLAAVYDTGGQAYLGRYTTSRGNSGDWRYYSQWDLNPIELAFS